MKKDNKRVVNWLLTGCFLIFIMVVVGGITRLTHSGLSITNYRILSGVIPPLNELEWNEAFERYKQFPEYKKLNTHFKLQDFKSIFFWEWMHRVIGRLIGLVFIIPFVYFLITRQLTRPTIKKSLVLLALGAFQGFLGWYMVKSGLVDHPDVSHYRLAAHLITAFLTCAYSLWVIMDIVYPRNYIVHLNFKKLLQIAFGLILLQIIYGAFMAGLDAGYVHPYWPMMSDGKFMHPTVYQEETPVLKNFIEGKSGVQFVHRILAICCAVVIFTIWYKSRKLELDKIQSNSVLVLVLLVIIQFILGVFTLYFQVPIWLGILHQIGAFFLFMAATFTLHRISK